MDAYIVSTTLTRPQDVVLLILGIYIVFKCLWLGHMVNRPSRLHLFICVCILTVRNR